MAEEFIIRIDFWKLEEGGRNLTRTSEKADDATEYRVTIISGSRASNAHRSEITVKRNERGFWAVSPNSIRSIANYAYQKGREDQANIMAAALNYKAFP